MLPHGEVYGDTSCMIDMFDIFHIQTKNIHQLLPLACKEVNIYIYCTSIKTFCQMHLAPKTMPPFYLSCLTPFTSPRILMSDLVKVGLLGAGGFGAVELWEHKATHETYVSW